MPDAKTFVANAPAWVDLASKDAAASRDYYAKLFGWKVEISGPDAGGYANAAAQDAFCANTYCWIAIIYDQSPKHNHLTQAPPGGFNGPGPGGFDNLANATAAPVTLNGQKAYGVFVAPGTGYRNDATHGTLAVVRTSGAPREAIAKRCAELLGGFQIRHVVE